MPMLNIRGVDVEFPFKPYDVQLDYMTKVIEALQTGQNAVLESPTGTGKTLCLLCSTLAWRKSEIAHLANAPPPDQPLLEGLEAWGANEPSKEVSANSVPKIIYASRTHSQLTQVVNELKRTSYGKSVVISVLGSREQMCIHPDVSQQTNNQTMVHMCHNKVSKRICQFYNNVEDARKGNVFTSEVMDIEDLVVMGRRRNACPYYSSREISKQAECSIIFTPYNYLLDRKSRRSHNLEIKGNIIIFDEAHNLEKLCEESASFDFTSLDFAHCIEEVGDLLKAVTKLSETGTVADGHEAGESTALSEFNKDELALMKHLFLTLEKNLDELTLPSTKNRSEPGRFIFEYFSQVNLDFDSYDILLTLCDKISSYLSTLSTSFRTRGTAVQKFSEIIKIVFNASDMVGADLASNRSKIAEVSKHYRVHISEEATNLKKKDLWNKDRAIVSKPTRTLSYWCFSPGYAMKDLVSSGVKNLVLTSGTLSPIESFTSELQVDFPITLENDHVIDRHQVFVASVSKGVGGFRLESTFKSRSDEDKVLELGRTVAEILKLSPGGTLVFFPSYSAMSHYVSLWTEKSTVMQMLELAKPCTVEPRGKGDLRSAIDKYYADVKAPDGGALFAVCRGKVSEGLDFANDNGRTVIIIGIPFPPCKDPKVQLKMSFLDDLRRSAGAGTNVIPGNEWYRQQACRAVNQAIGRVIRHRYDFGSIILCDYRYSNKDQIEELPKWIQCHVNNFDDCPKFLRRLKSFFCSIREKERIRLKSSENGNSAAATAEKVKTKTPASTPSGKISFSVAPTQDYIKSFPKANEVDIHVPSKGCSWKEKILKPSAPSTSESIYSFFNMGGRKRASECCTSASNSSKKRVGLIDALDDCNNVIDDVNIEEEGHDHVGEAVAHRLSTHMLVLDKRLENERLNKKKKIKLKPSSRSTNSNTTDDASNPADNVTTKASQEQLQNGPAQFYLDNLRVAVNKEDYQRFKGALRTYKQDRDVTAIVNELSCFLLDNTTTRDLLKTFVRFINEDHKTLYSSLVDQVIAKSVT